jgi:histidine triad (HIT) family protein
MSVCVFCEKIREGSVVQARGGIYHFEPLNPVVRGHRLFVAREHFALPDHMPPIAGLVFEEAARYAGAHGGAYNLIVNAGTSASQTIPHMHVHFVPRERNDGLMLPWTDQEKP